MNLTSIKITCYSCVFCLLIFAYAWLPVNGSSDLYAHAAVGRWIIAHRAVPHHTLFLWSVQQKWVAHSWLSEIGLSRLLSFGEVRGVALCVGLAAALFCLTYLLLWFSRPSLIRMPWSLPLLFACGILAGSPRFLPRPEACTNLFSAIVLVVLLRRPESTAVSSRLFWGQTALSFVFFLLWANLHGGVILGILLVALTVVCDSVQRGFDQRAQALAAMLVAGLAGLLMTPYRLDYISIYSQINSRVFREIEEWAPTFQVPILRPDFVVAALILALTAFFLRRQRPERRLAEAAWLLYAIVAFVVVRRNIFFLVIVCLALITAYAPELRVLEERVWTRFVLSNRGLGPLRIRRIRRLLAAIPLLLMLAVFAHTGFVTRREPLTLVRADLLPIRQTDFLLAHDVSGNIYNDYNNAAYLEWRLSDRCAFFIDGLNAYGDDLLDPETHVFAADPDGLRYLSQNDVDCVAGRNKEDGEKHFPPLYYRLTHDPDWTLAYAERDGPVWFRRRH